MLKWVQGERGNLEAFGLRGCYVIHRAPGGFAGCVLTATGHDTLPMLEIPPYGKSFPAPHLAKDYAEGLDSKRVVEAEAGAG